jgi:putative ABC transport system permease protein
MTALRRKLARDLLHLRGQLGAVALVVACGVALFIAIRSAHNYLLATQLAYYRAYRFADAFAHVRSAPPWVARAAAAVPGVGTVETRIVEDVVLDVPGLAEPAQGRLISVPTGSRPRLDDLYLRRGRWLDPARRNEALVSEAFARANRLQPGASVGAVINGRWQRLRIAGIALSPEYVYAIPGTGQLLPDDRRFGILWMDEDQLATAFDLKGSWNDLTLSLLPGAVAGEVIGRLDRLLARYGSLGAYGRDEQLSHRFVSDKIAQVRVMSVLLPTVFLAVAAFLLHIVMARLVATQREQIAVLKAFGYGNRPILVHYLELGLAAVLAGAVPGVVFGLWLAEQLAVIYARYYQFPALSFAASPALVAAALATAGGAALLGAARAARAASSLPPAVAMQPPAPPAYRVGLLERLGLGRRLPAAARGILRNLERQPGKAALSTLVIALAAALVIVGLFSYDAIAVLRELQFGEIDRQDLTLTFVEPRSGQVRSALAHLPGVLRSEPFRAVAVRFRHGQRSRRCALLGLPSGAVLHRVVDARGRARALPPAGLLLNRELARILDVAPGGTVTVEVLEGERPVREVPVAGLVEELLGLSAYMDERALHRLLREGDTVSGAYLQIDRSRAAELYALLKRLPAVAGAAIHEAVVASFDSAVGESYRALVSFLLGFACSIAFGIIYNGARITLSERGRELASLRVLGFSRGEVTAMLLGEQALWTVCGLPAGCLIGYLMAAAIAERARSELYRIPLVVGRTTYALACLVVVAAAAISGFLVRRRIDRLDLVEVLKTRE